MAVPTIGGCSKIGGIEVFLVGLNLASSPIENPFYNQKIMAYFWPMAEKGWFLECMS
jgi:hypothetical protein